MKKVKEALRNLTSVLGNLALILLALVLFLPLIIIAAGWKFYITVTNENRKAREILTGTGKFFVSIAIALDQLGNAAFGGMFNQLLIKDASLFPFGQPHETISEALGWNKMLPDNMTPKGEKLVKAIEWFDFTTKQHCIGAAAKGLEAAIRKADLYNQHLSHWKIKNNAA